jgi:hypothetical protein
MIKSTGKPLENESLYYNDQYIPSEGEDFFRTVGMTPFVYLCDKPNLKRIVIEWSAVIDTLDRHTSILKYTADNEYIIDNESKVLENDKDIIKQMLWESALLFYVGYRKVRKEHTVFISDLAYEKLNDHLEIVLPLLEYKPLS